MGDFEFDISADASRLLGDIPKGLRKPLLTEFNKILKNYREHRWEPAELNGGLTIRGSLLDIKRIYVREIS